MKGYKKDQLKSKQRYIAILKTNKQLARINVIILSIGLALSYLGKDAPSVNVTGKMHGGYELSRFKHLLSQAETTAG